MSKLTEFEEAVLDTIKGQPYEDQHVLVNYRCNGTEKIAATHLEQKGYLIRIDDEGRYFKPTAKGNKHKWIIKPNWEK